MVNCSPGAVGQNELIPPPLCPAVFSHSLSPLLLFFIVSIYLSSLTPFYPFQTHHFPVSSWSTPLLFSIFQTVVTFPNLSAFMCFPPIKRLVKKANIGQEIGMSRRCLISPGTTQEHTNHTYLTWKCTH